MIASAHRRIRVARAAASHHRFLDGGAATAAALYRPVAVEIGPDGSLYIVESQGNRIRRVTPDGIINTVAGTGSTGYGGDGGPAIEAQLRTPYDVAIDADGSIYIADLGNSRIRRVGPNGIITTVAGTGTHGYNGDNIPAVSAMLNNARSIALGPDGSLYIADRNNYRIRRVSPAGIITTVAGTGESGYTGDNSLATAARINPWKIASDLEGNLYIATTNGVVRRVDTSGIITTIAGTGITGFSGDLGLATEAQFGGNIDVTVGSDQSLYIADTGNNRIRRVDVARSIADARDAGGVDAKRHRKGGAQQSRGHHEEGKRCEQSRDHQRMFGATRKQCGRVGEEPPEGRRHPVEQQREDADAGPDAEFQARKEGDGVLVLVHHASDQPAAQEDPE